MLAQGRPATVDQHGVDGGDRADRADGPVCASKFGVVGMSEALNAELSAAASA